jgi:putative serine protease PepD
MTTTWPPNSPYEPPQLPLWGQPPQPPRPRRSGRRAAIAGLALACAVGGGAAGAAVGIAVHGGSSPTTLTSVGAPASTETAAQPQPGSYAAIAAKVLPSVVSIDVSGSGEEDTGSGVIIRSDGYILTNNHVVAAAAQGGSVRVTFNDGSSTSASIVGTDATSDLAVIKVSRTGLTAATLGDAGSAHVGDQVLAIGSPLGLSGTVTEGIISAKDRPVETSDSQQQSLFGGGSPATTVIDAIQTDAAINPGNSGGALVDMAGRVIGINSAIATVGGGGFGGGQSGNIGVGFAIPINQAKVIAEQLITTGHASHSVLGVSIADATANDGSDLVVVRQVSAGGPAQQAGLQVGDVITAVDGSRVSSADALVAAIRAKAPGTSVQITYQRGGTSHTVSVTLADATSSG